MTRKNKPPLKPTTSQAPESEPALQTVLNRLDRIEEKLDTVLQFLSKLRPESHQAQTSSDPGPPENITPLPAPNTEAPPTDTPIFISYCWVNSRDAAIRGDVKEVIGEIDPRQVHADLNQKGVNCWLDIYQLGSQGLMEDIATALIAAKAAIVFVSDEYAQSDNCRMELQYARKTLHLPIIPIVVGRSWEWRKSVVGLLLADDLYIDCTDPEKYPAKFGELIGRLEKLVGEKANIEEYRKAANVKSDTAEAGLGDRFEFYYDSPETWLRFTAEFSKEARDGRFKDQPGELLCCPYYWPVNVIDVDRVNHPDELKVEYLGYEGDWDEWVPLDKLRPPQFPSLSTAGLQVGSHVAARLQQGEKGTTSYCWVEATVLSIDPDEHRAKIKVATYDIDPMVEFGEAGFDECYVNINSLFIFPGPGGFDEAW